MSQEFKLPELGENIATAGVISVLVQQGQTIAANTPVLEIETDKATIEVPCSLAGTITKVHVQAGQKAAVGQVVLTLDDGAQAEPPRPAPLTSTPAANGEVAVRLPFLGESVTSAKVLQLLASEGQEMQPDTALLEIETDKATVEVPGGLAGRLKKLHIQPGQVVQVGQEIAVLEGATAAPPPPPLTMSPLPQPPPTPIPSKPVERPSPRPPAPTVAASPTVRRLAREIGVDISQVRGTGPRGRISHDDVKAQARTLLKRAVPAAAGAAPGLALPRVELPDFSRFGAVEREPMTGIRQRTAQQMALAWSTVPMVTQFDKADITGLEQLRQKLDVKARQQGHKLTVTAILLRLVASALKRFPKFNASLDLDQQEVVYKKYFHVGVAVDTERGLLVPVVRDVERKNVFELSQDLQQLAEKARQRKITPDDLQGSCFTITNLGGIGGTAFTPIVNPPEVAILGVSRSATEPVWSEGAFVPRTLLPLSLSYDHRLIDGADAARFLRFLCEALENPAILIFEG